MRSGDLAMMIGAVMAMVLIQMIFMRSYAAHVATSEEASASDLETLSISAHSPARSSADGWPSGVRIQHDSSQIVYQGVVWKTPAASVIAAVASGIMRSPHGQVGNASGVYDFGKWYWNPASNSNKRSNVPRRWGAPSKELKPKEFAYPLLSFVCVYDNLFQHIVFDVLPKVAFTCAFLQNNREVRVVVMNDLAGALVREACDVAPERFVEFAHRAFLAPVVYVPYFESGLKLGMVPPNSLRSLGPQSKTGTEVVYLPRDAGMKRSVENEAEVLATLRQRWPALKVLKLTNDWRKDRVQMERARIIVAPHGGALSNMIFAPVNTTIVEFLPLVRMKLAGENERPCYFGLAHGLGFTYHAVEPSRFDFNNGSMTVPAARLKAVLSQIPASDERR